MGSNGGQPWANSQLGTEDLNPMAHKESLYVESLQVECSEENPGLYDTFNKAFEKPRNRGPRKAISEQLTRKN